MLPGGSECGIISRQGHKGKILNALQSCQAVPVSGIVRIGEVRSVIIVTKRLLIRDLKTEDADSFVQMAADGSLNDIGFDKDCGEWMAEWIEEAKEFALRDDPNSDYLAYGIDLKSDGRIIGSIGCSYYEDLQETGITYFIEEQHRKIGYAAEAVKAYAEFFLRRYKASRLIATVREENTASWKTIEKAGFKLTAKRVYKDLNDKEAQMYRFYEIRSSAFETFTG